MEEEEQVVRYRLMVYVKDLISSELFIMILFTWRYYW